MTTRSAWINAPIERVWARVAALDWERWDPDLTRIEGAELGLVDGSRGVFAMKNGQRFNACFHHVRPPRRCDWSADGVGGLVRAEGELIFEEEGGGTRFTYRFGMGGVAGRILARLMRRRIGHAIEHCVDGLARLVAHEQVGQARNDSEPAAPISAAQ